MRKLGVGLLVLALLMTGCAKKEPVKETSNTTEIKDTEEVIEGTNKETKPSKKDPGYGTDNIKVDLDGNYNSSIYIDENNVQKYDYKGKDVGYTEPTEGTEIEDSDPAGETEEAEYTEETVETEPVETGPSHEEIVSNIESILARYYNRSTESLIIQRNIGESTKQAIERIGNEINKCMLALQVEDLRYSNGEGSETEKTSPPETNESTNENEEATEGEQEEVKDNKYVINLNQALINAQHIKYKEMYDIIYSDIYNSGLFMLNNQHNEDWFNREHSIYMSTYLKRLKENLEYIEYCDIEINSYFYNDKDIIDNWNIVKDNLLQWRAFLSNVDSTSDLHENKIELDTDERTSISKFVEVLNTYK